MIPQASQLSPLDRFFGLFTKMRPGEGRSVFLFFWLGFIFMFGQWILKPIRDVFILSEADAEMAAYGNAVQAVLLMLVIPLYGVLYRRLTKTRLVQAVTLFFIATLLLFYFLYEAGNSIYFPFYIWVGLYGTMLIAQFWALAADHYNVKSGQRLFGVFAAGVSLGALVGPLTVSTFVATLGTGNLLLLVAAALGVTLFLVNPSVNAIPEGSRSTGAKDDEKKKSSFLGGFATVLSDRYLTLIAFWVVLQNIIDSTGDYILKTWVKKHANELVASGESTLGVGEQIGVIFGNFYFVQNLVTFLLALLVVSRVLRVFGIQKAIRIFLIDDTYTPRLRAAQSHRAVPELSDFQSGSSEYRFDHWLSIPPNAPGPYHNRRSLDGSLGGDCDHPTGAVLTKQRPLRAPIYLYLLQVEHFDELRLHGADCKFVDSNADAGVLRDEDRGRAGAANTAA